MRTDGNLGGNLNYEPNRAGDFAQDRNAVEPPLAAGAAWRYDHREDDDYYSQPAALFRLFDAAQRERFFGNIARHIRGVPDDIIERQLGHFRRIDPAYGTGRRGCAGETGCSGGYRGRNREVAGGRVERIATDAAALRQRVGAR